MDVAPLYRCQNIPCFLKSWVLGCLAGGNALDRAGGLQIGCYNISNRAARMTGARSATVPVPAGGQLRWCFISKIGQMEIPCFIFIFNRRGWLWLWLLLISRTNNRRGSILFIHWMTNIHGRQDCDFPSWRNRGLSTVVDRTRTISFYWQHSH